MTNLPPPAAYTSEPILKIHGCRQPVEVRGDDAILRAADGHEVLY